MAHMVEETWMFLGLIFKAIGEAVNFFTIHLCSYIFWISTGFSTWDKHEIKLNMEKVEEHI